MIELRVLISESAFAPAATAARAGGTMFVMLGVSFTMTGTRATSITQLRDLLAIFRHLADGGSHAALAHAVGAAVVQFDAVGAGVFDPPDDVVPGFRLRFDHGGHNNGAVGPGAFHIRDLAQIDIERTVGDQLDVVDREHLVVAIVPAPHSDWRHSVPGRRWSSTPLRPSRLQTPVDLRSGIGGRRGSQPERIRRFDAREIEC